MRNSTQRLPAPAVHLDGGEWTLIGAELDGSWRPARMVGRDSNTDQKEKEMNKALSIALGVAFALVTATTAQADPPEARPFASPSSGQQIIAQERGRSADARLFQPSSAPVQVVGPSDRFDVRDAAIGGAAGLALALLAVAGVAHNSSRRQRPAPATSAAS